MEIMILLGTLLVSGTAATIGLVGLWRLLSPLFRRED